MEPIHAETNHAVQPKTFLRCKEVCARTSLSRSYIYQLARQGKFPQPIDLVPGGSSVAWIEDEVNQWINDRIESARGTAQ